KGLARLKAIITSAIAGPAGINIGDVLDQLPLRRRPLDRAMEFCSSYGLKLPVLLAPMAGACPVALSSAVSNAGGMGAMGAVITPPSGIRSSVEVFWSVSHDALQHDTGYTVS